MILLLFCLSLCSACRVPISEHLQEKEKEWLRKNKNKYAQACHWNHIYIKNAEQNTSYSIYNYEGRLMKKIKTRDVNMKIDISDLTPGIYLIYNKKTRQSETFVKQ